MCFGRSLRSQNVGHGVGIRNATFVDERGGVGVGDLTVASPILIGVRRFNTFSL